jgi:hypothetical protein
VVLKQEKIWPIGCVGVFLKEDSSLNSLKVDRIQDIENKIKFDFFFFKLNKRYICPL